MVKAKKLSASDLTAHIGYWMRLISNSVSHAFARKLQANGVTIVGATDHTVTHSLYIEDPDGNEIELYVDVPGIDWASDPTLIAAPIE